MARILPELFQAPQVGRALRRAAGPTLFLISFHGPALSPSPQGVAQGQPAVHEGIRSFQFILRPVSVRSSGPFPD